MAVKININSLPPYAKILISLLPAIVLSVAVFMLVIAPKQKEIKALDAQIDTQNNEIASSQAKAAKLDILKQENERLIKRINELKEQLPEEKEISSLLKQVSDLGIAAGLEIKSWKPSQKVLHSSGIVYEIPVSVEASGTYHNLGYFLSSLTKLNRIVNIGDMKLSTVASAKGTPKGDTILNVSFKASTFSAVPESEIGAAGPRAQNRRKPRTTRCEKMTNKLICIFLMLSVVGFAGCNGKATVGKPAAGKACCKGVCCTCSCSG